MTPARTVACLGLLLGALLSFRTAHAEGGCPPGYYPIGAPSGQQGPQGCAPIPGYEQVPRQQEPEQWEEPWISLAIDPVRGVLGVDTDEVYWSVAQTDALIECKTRGGVKCRTWETFKNACGVVVTGRDYHVAIETDEGTAADKAMRKCKQEDGPVCRVLFSGCSRPVRVAPAPARMD
ncbi:DUF4189 domain-containing protein [Frateuria soli]|uniref:DUF4189 domain-containing protein n=1 Tax=Frateuria soli TaxID=1542730 RepID=UPI001E4D1354|nr:DUF4189 domain-containing protein [Frateuria soli]UGB39388.1 DUF4189 domain-containing protein [Frateuria soli]